MSASNSTLTWSKVSKKLDKETTRTEHSYDQRDLWSSLNYPTINNAADTTNSTISDLLPISREAVMALLRSSGVSIESGHREQILSRRFYIHSTSCSTISGR